MVTSFCGASSPAAGLRFTGSASQREAAVTLTDTTLVLDYGGPCDAPVDTYQRLP
ncbi:hypothetical protein [Hymenobacter negativus]|uniref:MBL fold metallo-hydrolase n=1 Tax=Hymenobacter negativus TaxID=2795026 RepID=A0ABS3QFC8_9BACT|nr:hypothetical protein [Hymenobacter negativus]MBO2009415.1 hypothetical protein [Hymenobacter negativus]